MEEESGGGPRVVAISLIEKATNSTASEVDPRLLKSIKSVVRSSDSELRIAAQTLMDLMKRDHAQVPFLQSLFVCLFFLVFLMFGFLRKPRKRKKRNDSFKFSVLCFGFERLIES